jgi:phenylacetate-CoA ligase
LFEEVFQKRIYSWYGHAEQGVLAGACEYNNNYHIFPEYGILEVIDENDRVNHSTYASGEAVTTGLNNFIMPLIRYKTGDIITMGDGNCECGRHCDLIKDVEGRKQEFIVLNDNSIISLTSLIIGTNYLEDFPSIVRYQFIQNEPGIVTLKLMGDKNKIPQDSKKLIFGLQKVIGDKLVVDIQHVDHISLTKVGKHKSLIQKLKIIN